MALYVVEHQHDASTCPAPNPEAGGQLLQALAGAPQLGVTVLAEAVVDGAHELHLIVTADTPEAVQRFMAPFGGMGSVSVRPASRCELVVERGHC